jgi:hypothetical protein
MRDAETTLLIIEDRGKSMHALPRCDSRRETDTETNGDRRIGSLESRILGNVVSPVRRGADGKGT